MRPDWAEVLAKHRIAQHSRIYPAWSCSCITWDGSQGGGAQDNIEAAEAHLASVLNAALADWLEADETRERVARAIARRNAIAWCDNDWDDATEAGRVEWTADATAALATLTDDTRENA